MEETSRIAATPQDDTLRIDAGKVGHLIDLVGELSLGVAEVVLQPQSSAFDPDEFEKSAYRLQSLVRELQNSVLSLRLVAVGEVFRRLRRMVRELERHTGKRIELALQGEETEIDKVVVDRLYEPLVHVIRNSADHGLEGPEEREAAGKPATGTITLSAQQVGGEVQIAIADDGRGLNRDKILKRARERGLVAMDSTPEDGALWKLIFQPGFSTAEAVTSLSGRGVGMDVLNTVVKDLRGRIQVDSEAGAGTRVTLAIPLTLAFLDCIIVRVAERLYAIPVDEILEVVQPGSRQITRIAAEGACEVVKLRERFVDVCRLQTFYGESAPLPMQAEQILVVLAAGDGRVGLAVDEIRDQQNLAMKPLLGQLKHIRAGLGCALLSSGEVVVILDCARLAEAPL